VAFESSGLYLTVHADGVTLWRYATPDAAADVCGPGYFDATADMLDCGDFITATTGSDGVQHHIILHVSWIIDGEVHVTNLTPPGANSPTQTPPDWAPPRDRRADAPRPSGEGR
jgi:hypothetical protein